MGFNITCCDIQSQVKSKEKASHGRATIVDSSGLLMTINNFIKNLTFLIGDPDNGEPVTP